MEREPNIDYLPCHHADVVKLKMYKFLFEILFTQVEKWNISDHPTASYIIIFGDDYVEVSFQISILGLVTIFERSAFSNTTHNIFRPS